jgi:hypothetical protein
MFRAPKRQLVTDVTDVTRISIPPIRVRAHMEEIRIIGHIGNTVTPWVALHDPAHLFRRDRGGP